MASVAATSTTAPAVSQPAPRRSSAPAKAASGKVKAPQNGEKPASVIQRADRTRASRIAPPSRANAVARPVSPSARRDGAEQAGRGQMDRQQWPKRGGRNPADQLDQTDAPDRPGNRDSCIEQAARKPGMPKLDRSETGHDDTDKGQMPDRRDHPPLRRGRPEHPDQQHHHQPMQRKTADQHAPGHARRIGDKHRRHQLDRHRQRCQPGPAGQNPEIFRNHARPPHDLGQIGQRREQPQQRDRAQQHLGDPGRQAKQGRPLAPDQAKPQQAKKRNEDRGGRAPEQSGAGRGFQRKHGRTGHGEAPSRPALAQAGAAGKCDRLRTGAAAAPKGARCPLRGLCQIR